MDSIQVPGRSRMGGECGLNIQESWEISTFLAAIPSHVMTTADTKTIGFSRFKGVISFIR